jgi:hypothetical protein
MMTPQITARYLSNGEMIVRVLFPNGTEKTMTQAVYVSTYLKR